MARVLVEPRAWPGRPRFGGWGLSRSFTTFLGGLAVSKLGDSVYTFALPWIAYDLTHSAALMGGLFATAILPIPLLGPFVGSIVDRVDRRRLMLTADALRAGMVATVPVAQMLGILQIWYLFVVAFGLALVSLAFDVSTIAAIPEIAGAELNRANAAHQGAMQIASMAGPAFAGLMIASVGGYQTLWLDAASFGATFLAVVRMPAFDVRECCRKAASVVQGIGEALRWLWGSPAIKMLALQAATGNFGEGIVAAVLVFYLRDTLGLGAELSGVNYALLGVGGILGSVAIVPLSRRYRKGALYPRMLAVGLFGLVMLALVRTWWGPGIGYGIVAACDTAWVVLSTSVRQELIPARLFGRVLSFSRVLSTAAMPLGALLGGYLVGVADPAVVFLLAAGFKGAEVLIARFSAISRL